MPVPPAETMIANATTFGELQKSRKKVIYLEHKTKMLEEQLAEKVGMLTIIQPLKESMEIIVAMNACWRFLNKSLAHGELPPTLFEYNDIRQWNTAFDTILIYDPELLEFTKEEAQSFIPALFLAYYSKAGIESPRIVAAANGAVVAISPIKSKAS